MNKRTLGPGAEIRAIRLRLGMTQPQLAETLGIHRVTLAKWEGGTHAPNPLALRLLRRIEADLTRTRLRHDRDPRLGRAMAFRGKANVQRKARPRR